MESNLRLIATVAVIAVILFVLQSCTESRSSTKSTSDGAVRVSGVVNGWFCYANSPFDPQPGDVRMAVYTGERPLIRAIAQDGRMKEFRTDELSGFRQYMDTGLWKFDIITRWSILDTFIIHIQNDTSIVFDIIYLVTNPDTLSVSFTYRTGTDTMGIWREWSIMQSFNQMIDDVLDLKSRVPVLDWRRVYKYPFGEYVWYQVPLADKSANVIEVSIAANDLILADSSNLISPIPFWTNASYYFCHTSLPNP